MKLGKVRFEKKQKRLSSLKDRRDSVLSDLKSSCSEKTNDSRTSKLAELNLLNCLIAVEERELSQIGLIEEAYDEDSVNIGDILSLTIESGDEYPVEDIFRIVDIIDSSYDFSIKPLTSSSPIGKAVINKKIGSQVQAETAYGKVIVTINEKVERRKR